jgi:ABC-three component (ABC-3C) system Middle Component 3
MPSSTAQSPVVAAMLNPAVIATIVAAAADEYSRAANEPLPWSMAFVVAPLVLHRGTREALPRRTSSHWAHWLSNNPVIQAGFAPRARSLVGPVRDGIRFGLACGVLVIDGDGFASGLRRSMRPDELGDLAMLVRAAGFVGKWLAKLDRPATAFALLGVAP